MHNRTLLLLGALSLAGPVMAADTAAPAGMPKVLSIGREEIKAGKGTAHQKLAGSFADLMTKANAPATWIGLEPISGDDNEVVFLQSYGSYAEIEAERSDMEKLISGALKTEVEQLDKQSSEVHARLGPRWPSTVKTSAITRSGTRTWPPPI